MVVTGINQSLGEVAKIATSLGSIEQIYPALNVIEIRVNNESFVRSPVEKLSDKTDPKFYELNKRELESIDMDRVYSAVKRLAGVEPTIYRSDITLQLISLLGQEWVEFKADVCKALAVWSENPGPAGEVALKEALKLRLKRKDVPVEMIALMVKEKTPGLIPVLDELWVPRPKLRSSAAFRPARDRTASPPSACSGGWVDRTVCPCWKLRQMVPNLKWQ
jgi:hypothetical protein